MVHREDCKLSFVNSHFPSKCHISDSEKLRFRQIQEGPRTGFSRQDCLKIVETQQDVLVVLFFKTGTKWFHDSVD